jgi:hypothetical protein
VGILVLWDVMLYRSVSGCRRFDVRPSTNETPGTTYQKARRQIPEDPNEEERTLRQRQASQRAATSMAAQ